MNRGDRREDMFLDDQDRGSFLDTLGEASAVKGNVWWGLTPGAPGVCAKDATTGDQSPTAMLMRLLNTVARVILRLAYSPMCAPAMPGLPK